jgi:TRAP transporter 4TM/12TM fusion protein
MTIDTDTTTPQVVESESRWLENALIVVSTVFWLGVMFVAWQQPLPRGQFTVVFMGGIVLIVLLRDLNESVTASNRFDAALLVLIGTISTVTTVYFYVEYFPLIQTRVGYGTDLDYVMAAIIVAVIFYLTAREFGIPFLMVILFTVGYGYFGSYFPGILNHAGLSETRMLETMVLNMEGVYGRLSRLVAAWIALFLLYAGLLQAYGAFDLVLRLSIYVGRYIRSGVAQTAVIASMIIGSVNGSATANTAITGSITIPLMKESGIRSPTAGAIESVASNGGQLIPPVMGASAFLMAGVVGVPYIDIVIAGIIPALIFYISVVIAVHYTVVYEMADDDVSGEQENDQFEEDLTPATIVVETVKFLGPMLLLVYLIGVLGYTIQTSALYTVLAMILTGAGFPLLRSTNWETLVEVGKQTIHGFKLGAIGLAPIAIVISGINAMVDVLITTGMAQVITLAIVDLAGGVLLLAIIFGMLICIVLGLGMPTSAAYLIVALLVAPTFINTFLVPDLAAHFFVFYAASLATITPPIATGIVVATGIAGSGFWATAKKAVKLSAHLFLLPVMFIYNPEVISPNLSLDMLFTGALGLFGAIAIIYGMNKPNLGLLQWQYYATQSVYVVLGTIIMVHYNDVLKLGALAAVVLFYIVMSRQEPTSSLAPETTGD